MIPFFHFFDGLHNIASLMVAAADGGTIHVQALKALGLKAHKVKDGVVAVGVGLETLTLTTKDYIDVSDWLAEEFMNSLSEDALYPGSEPEGIDEEDFIRRLSLATGMNAGVLRQHVWDISKDVTTNNAVRPENEIEQYVMELFGHHLKGSN